MMASKQTNKQKHSKNNDKKTVSILSKEAFFFLNQGSIIYSTGQQKYSSPMNSGLKLTEIA